MSFGLFFQYFVLSIFSLILIYYITLLLIIVCCLIFDFLRYSIERIVDRLKHGKVEKDSWEFR